MDDWINMIEPYNSSEIVGNRQSIKELKLWLKEPLKTTSLILGQSGTGKSLVAKYVLKEANYEVNIISFSDHHTGKSITSFINEINKSTNVLSFFEPSVKSKKQALIVDNLECMAIQMKQCLINILELRNSMPIIIICNSKYHKLLDVVKKYSTIYTFEKPKVCELWQWVMNINEIFSINITKKLTEDLIISCNRDIYQITLWLYKIHDWVKKGKKTPYIRKMLKIIPNKDNDVGLIDATIECYKKYTSFKQVDRLYNLDRILLPRMCHENLFSVISQKNDKCKFVDIDNISRACDYFSIADLMYEKIHNPPHDDNLHSLMAVFSCYIPQQEILNLDSRCFKKIEPEDMKFPKLMTIRYQTSVNSNYISRIPKSLRNIDRYCIGNSIKKYVKTKNIPELVEICKRWGCSPSILDKITKVSCFNKKSLRISKTMQKNMRVFLNNEGIFFND
tara:strand:- start:33 stop:1382 length:1350 start_codon:yes stop_codon:yes gene_type:complete